MSPINFEEDAVTKLNQEELEDVASLLQRQLKAELDVEIAEVELDKKKEELRKLSEEIIPARMTELGMTREEATKMLGKDVFEQQGKVPIWPTPTANEDAAGRPGGKMQKMLGNHPEVRKPLGGGTLNPTWVEWLMGYPSGWTDLKD